VAQVASAVTVPSERKSAKYSGLSSSHIFCPVAIETLGPLANEAQHFLMETGRRAMLYAADKREAVFCINEFPWQFSASTPYALPTS